MKILLADDDLLFRTLLKRSVSGCGSETVVVSDGEQAWREITAADSPRLAILDWIMPGTDGLEVCRRIRQANLPLGS